MAATSFPRRWMMIRSPAQEVLLHRLRACANQGGEVARETAPFSTPVTMARERSSSFCRGMGDLGRFASWNLCFRPSRNSLGGDSPESRLQAALPMRQLTLFLDNAPGPRWIAPPWTTASDRWLEIDRDLPVDHRARRIVEIVAELDLTPLVDSYAGLGSPAHPPALLVRLALFEIHRGCLSPVQWFEDCRYDDPVKWLIFGLRPSRSCLYQFRDRIGPYLDPWNRSVLRSAQAEGWTPAKRASVDGTFTASYASRHVLIKGKTLAERCQQLDTAVAADFSAPVASPPEPAPATDPTPASTSAAAPLAMADPATRPAAAPTPAAQPSWMAKTPGGRFRQQRRYHQAQELLQKRQEQKKQTMSRRAKAKRRSPEQMKISLTDPEAALGFDKTTVFRPLFNIQLACDLDSGFVLGHDVFPAATDANLLGPMVERTRDLSGKAPEVALGDSKYASILDLKLCDDQGITMYAPVSDNPSQLAGPVPPSVAPGGCGADPSQPAEGPGGSPSRSSVGCPSSRRIAARRVISWSSNGRALSSGRRGSWSSRSIAARPSTARPARWRAGAPARPSAAASSSGASTTTGTTPCASGCASRRARRYTSCGSRRWNGSSPI